MMIKTRTLRQQMVLCMTSQCTTTTRIWLLCFYEREKLEKWIGQRKSDPKIVSQESTCTMQTGMDVQRVASVLNYAIEKLDLLSAMAPEIQTDREDLSQLVNDEISKIIEEQ